MFKKFTMDVEISNSGQNDCGKYLNLLYKNKYGIDF
jgi:hypothetical protein